MQTSKRLIRQVPTFTDMDTVKARQKKFGKDKDIELLERCRDSHATLEEFRRHRARAFRYTYVDQLSDNIEVDGKVMTMRQYLTSTGNVALQTNQMKNKVERMEGVIIKQALEPICKARDDNEQEAAKVLVETLKANCKKNKFNKLMISWTKEACLGGLMVAYESWDSTSGTNGKYDSWTQYVNPNMFFMDCNMDDPRFFDMVLVGRTKKYDFGKLCANFAHNERDYAVLCDLYPTQSSLYARKAIMFPEERFDEDSQDFMADPDPSVCCVCEAWTKETKARIRLHDTNAGTEEIIDADDTAYRKIVRKENERRKVMGLKAGWKEEEIPFIEGDGYGVTEDDKNGFFIDEYWYCRDLAPDGTILWEGESPFADRQHPFTVCAIPMVDGKIIGFEYEMIDHNDILNRSVCLNDWLIRSNAKGVVVVPKQIVPKNMSPEQFAKSWTSIDDMVFIDVKPGQENMMPKVFYGQAQTFDVAKYLDTFSKMGDKATSNTEALQGVTPFSGVSGVVYSQMENSSATGIASFVTTMNEFFNDVEYKKLKNIASFYDTKKYLEIVGNDIQNIDLSMVNFNDIPNLEYDFDLIQSTDTPAYNAALNQDMKELLFNHFIDIETYADMIKANYKEKLKQHITRIREEMAERQAAEQQQQQMSQQTIVQPGQSQEQQKPLG